MTVKFPDPDGDNAFIIIPFTFTAYSDGLINDTPVLYANTRVASGTNTQELTPTSASILAELGVLNLLLQELIPQLIYEITGVSHAGLGYNYDDCDNNGKCCSKYYGYCY